MDNLFLKYMREQSEKPTTESHRTFSHHKPVITISREYGCPGNRIAETLTQILTNKNHINGGQDQWKWLSKEIIDDTAHKLKMTPSLINEIANKKERGFFENIALFFSDEYYPTDGKVQNTIAGFIHQAAEEGYVVLLGRAAEIITQNFTNAIHIKLFAPIDWRNEIVSIEENVSHSTAKKICAENDRQREAFRNYFRGEKDPMSFYDMTFNCKTLSDDEIIEMILILAESRGFV